MSKLKNNWIFLIPFLLITYLLLYIIFLDKSESISILNYKDNIVRLAIIISAFLSLILVIILTLKNIKMTNHIKMSEERLNIAFTATNDIIFDYDTSKDIIHVNNLYHQIFGIGDIKLNFKEHFANFLHPLDKNEALNIIEQYLNSSKDNFKLPFRMIDKNKDIIWCLFRGQVIRKKQNPTRLIGTLQNINEQKKLEDNLLIAKRETEILNVAKVQFMQNITHELKTPLNSISGNLYSLKRTNLSEEQYHLTKKLGKSTKNLSKIITNILDLSNHNKAQKITEFNIFDALKIIYLTSLEKAIEKNIILSIKKEKEVPAILNGDIVNLNIILELLIDNAIKFTDNGDVQISVSKLESRNEKIKLLFCVKDTGIGIKEENLKDIIKSFTQLDGSKSRKYGDLGIGLSIVKEKLYFLKSKLEIDTNYNIGTEVKFALSFIYPKNNKFDELLLSNETEIAEKKENSKIKLLKPLPQEILNDLNELKSLCEKNNLKALSFLKTLKEKKLNEYIAVENIIRLEKTILDYDFDESLEIINKI